MHCRLAIRLLLLSAIALAGCRSTRPWQLIRDRAAPAQLAQASVDVPQYEVESLTAAPPRLPPGNELPPEPVDHSDAIPTASEPSKNDAKGSVVFASSQ